MQIDNPNRKAYRIEMENSLSSIQEVSDRLRVPKHTLRFWEKECEGIFEPLRTPGGQRRYTPEDISVIEQIKRLRRKGVSLVHVKKELTNHCRVTGDNTTNSEKIDLLANRITELVMSEIKNFFRG